jgi:hypothetical protein
MTKYSDFDENRQKSRKAEKFDEAVMSIFKASVSCATSQPQSSLSC